MSGGPTDMPALLEEVRNMADRAGKILITMIIVLAVMMAGSNASVYIFHRLQPLSGHFQK